jgi:hypothetical protein
MLKPEPQYQSYLLRLWPSGEGNACRVMLEHIGTHERHGFADLEDLCAFLQKQMNDDVMLVGERDGSI